jgi:hypothetical protein
MIKAKLVLNKGLLTACRISGHAGAGKQGNDIVCAAVSVLARTAYKVLAAREGIAVVGGNPERGEFWMEADCTALHDNENKAFLAGVGTFLEEGLLSVSAEFPENCQVSIEEKS